MLVAFVLVLLLGYVFLAGADSGSGGARAFDLFSIETDAPVGGDMQGDGFHDATLQDDLPPQSTLSHDGIPLTSQGQILGLWEAPGFFSPSNGSGIRSRVEGPLTLTDSAPYGPRSGYPELPLRRRGGPGA